MTMTTNNLHILWMGIFERKIDYRVFDSGWFIEWWQVIDYETYFHELPWDYDLIWQIVLYNVSNCPHLTKSQKRDWIGRLYYCKN